MKFKLDQIHTEGSIEYPKYNLPFGKCLYINDNLLPEDTFYYEVNGPYLTAVNPPQNLPTVGSVLAVFTKVDNKYIPYELYYPYQGKVPKWIKSGKELMRILSEQINL